MKAVIILLCLVALASAQVVRRRHSLRQRCPEDDYTCLIEGRRGIFDPNLIQNLIGTLVHKVADYIFPTTGLRNNPDVLNSIESLITWVVGEVVKVITEVPILPLT
uniref:Uncharacterized protein n=1 Tax=Anopheles minimus TaxID=112268 RepID=A0A182VUP3_9DIPT